MPATIDHNALGFMMQNAWVIPFLPFVTFLICGFLGRVLGDRLVPVIATASVFVSAIWGYAVAYEYYTMFHDGGCQPIIPFAFEWLSFQENLAVNVGVLLDPISIMLIVVVTTVSALVHLYSIGYMHGDHGIRRYFTFLNLFTFTMLGLVVAPNILQTFICWEGVGICSFLLIGFYYEKPSAVSASKKAFIVTRFADLGFLLGMIILGWWGFESFAKLAPIVQAEVSSTGGLGLQPFDFQFLCNENTLNLIMAEGPSFLGLNALTWALLLIFIGAAGKSAMFPLHIWLPDAMEGPTPVSALIHAATMVVAGVYLVARLFTGFAMEGTAILVVAYVGAFTCLFAALIGCTQDDIKRVLAFSTLSQLGYMMFALGVATLVDSLGYTASMFHLLTHAFFKSLLFLGAGAIIHAVHSNEIWDMGGLRKKMPVTHITFLIATLAIAGVPPLAGFYSKDEILTAASHHHQFIYFLGLAVAGITAFYMFRIYFVTFWGKHRSENAEHAHEAPPVMYIPLIILACLSVVAGFVWPYVLHLGNLVTIGEPLAHHGLDWSVATPSIGVGLFGIFMAWFMYAGDGARARAAAKALGPAYVVVKQKFYIDEVYLFITKRVIFRFVATPVAWFDRHVVDGGVNLSGWCTRTTGSLFSLFQTGQVQTYGAWLLSGLVFILICVWAYLT